MVKMKDNVGSNKELKVSNWRARGGTLDERQMHNRRRRRRRRRQQQQQQVASQLIRHHVFGANIQVNQSRTTSHRLFPAHATEKTETHALQSRCLPSLHSRLILASHRSQRTPKPEKSNNNDTNNNRECLSWIHCRIRTIPPPSLKIPTQFRPVVSPQASPQQRGGKPLFDQRFTSSCSALTCGR